MLGNNSLLRGGKKEEKGEEGGKKKREKKREEKRRKRGKGREREKCRLLFNFPPIQLFLFIRMNLKTLKNLLLTSFEERRRGSEGHRFKSHQWQTKYFLFGGFMDVFRISCVNIIILVPYFLRVKCVGSI